MASRGRTETAQLKKQVQEQLDRLMAQLQDLEDSRADLEASEYDEMRRDTLVQLSEFNVSLKKMMAGDMTLVDEISSVQLAIQAAVSEAFKTPEVIKLFAQKHPQQLRQRLENLQREHKLKNVPDDRYTASAVEILFALKRLGEKLSDAEVQFLHQNQSAALAQFERADDSVGAAKVMQKAQADLMRETLPGAAPSLRPAVRMHTLTSALVAIPAGEGDEQRCAPAHRRGRCGARSCACALVRAPEHQPVGLRAAACLCVCVWCACMDVVEANAGLLTNVEVLSLLRGKTKRSSQQRKPFHALQDKLRRYLTAMCGGIRHKQVPAFVDSLAPYALTAAEIVQLVNHRPKELVDVYLIIEECDERFSQEEAEAILELCRKLPMSKFHESQHLSMQGDRVESDDDGTAGDAAGSSAAGAAAGAAAASSSAQAHVSVSEANGAELVHDQMEVDDADAVESDDGGDGGDGY